MFFSNVSIMQPYFTPRLVSHLFLFSFDCGLLEKKFVLKLLVGDFFSSRRYFIHESLFLERMLTFLRFDIV